MRPIIYILAWTAKEWLLFSFWATLTFRQSSGYLQCVIGHTEDNIATVQMSVSAHWHLDSCQCLCLSKCIMDVWFKTGLL